MEGHQQGYRNVFIEFFFMAAGALAPFTKVPVREDIEIVVADPATNEGFMQIVVKPYRRLEVFLKSQAFQVHDSLLDIFLGPCHGCGYNDCKKQDH